MSIFKKTAKAEKSSGGRYFTPGHYVVDVEFFGEFTNRDEQDCLKLTTVVVETTSEDYSPGDEVGQVWNPSKSKFPKMTYGDMLAASEAVLQGLALAAADEGEEVDLSSMTSDAMGSDVFEQEMEAVCDPKEQPAKGVRLYVNVWQKTEGGFTKVDFYTSQPKGWDFAKAA